MANTYVDYTAVASQTDYNFSFEYLRDDHVKVKVNDVIATNYTIVTSPVQLIRFNTAPLAGATIKIYRDSRGDFSPLVDFVDGSVLTENELDESYKHNLFVAQEASEGQGGEQLTKKGLTHYDAEGNKIINLGTPGDSTDAANKGYVDQTIDNAIALGGSPAIVSLGGYDVTDITGSLTQSLSNWTAPTATGSTTARSLADRFGDVVNVLDYIPQSLHADIKAGTSTTNVKSYFTAALGSYSDKTSLYIPSGTYYFGDSSLNLGINKKLYGESRQTTVLEWAFDSETSAIVYDQYCHLENFRMINTGSDHDNTIALASWTPEDTNGGSNSIIRNIWIGGGLFNGPTVNAGSFIVGQKYKIKTVADTSGGATTDFTLIGAPDNDIGTKFIATGVGTGTGSAHHSNAQCWGYGLAATNQQSGPYTAYLGRSQTYNSLVDFVFFVGCGKFGVYLGVGANQLKFQNCFFRRHQALSTSGTPAEVRLNNALGVEFSQCLFEGSTIPLDFSMDLCQNIAIKDCYFEPAKGIYANTCPGLIVDGNVLNGISGIGFLSNNAFLRCLDSAGTSTYDRPIYSTLKNNVNRNVKNSISSDELEVGVSYTIVYAGTSDFTLVGAADNNPGTIFIATGDTPGDGTVYKTITGTYYWVRNDQSKLITYVSANVGDQDNSSNDTVMKYSTGSYESDAVRELPKTGDGTSDIEASWCGFDGFNYTETSLSLDAKTTITNATNASPIVITATGHGLTTGKEISIRGVLGNTAANVTNHTVTVIDANSFSLNGTTGNGGYTSGGEVYSTKVIKSNFATLTEDIAMNLGNYRDQGLLFVQVFNNISNTSSIWTYSVGTGTAGTDATTNVSRISGENTTDQFYRLGIDADGNLVFMNTHASSTVTSLFIQGFYFGRHKL